MGCGSSRDKVCPNCQTSYLPVRRSNSLYSRRYRKTGDYTNHVVSLTSSTLGSLTLDPEESSSSSSSTDQEFSKWSKLIEEKIPKTPAFTPPREAEKINAWELMEGLEDISPLKPHPKHHFRTLSFNLPKIDQQDLDHSNFDLPQPKTPLNLTAKQKDKLIVYFTSLRGVRKTYEECSEVLAILQTLGVRIYERDVSMHSGFKQELKELIGDRKTSLPSVFIGKRYIGDGEEIRRLNEEGKLREIVEGCEDEVEKECGVCGNIRFIPCQKCSGSCKILNEEDDDEEEDDHGFHRCPDCNENGLLSCPICCH